MQLLARGVPPGIGRPGRRWRWVLAPAAASVLALSLGVGPVLPSVVGTGRQPQTPPEASTHLIPPVAAADPLLPAANGSAPTRASSATSSTGQTASSAGQTTSGGSAAAASTTAGTVSSPTPVTHPAASQAPVPQSVIPYSAADLMLMARVVHGEATGQPATAKLGVAAVIVNRVRDPGWPKTIPAVIYAPGQFQSVGHPLFESAPSPADIHLARLALEGDDPTGGAVYFFAAARTPSGSPMFELHTLVVLGAFTFAS